MTWPKYGTEFVPQCADADLSDAAFRTHVEAIAYLYQVENPSLEIRKSRMRNVAHSEDWQNGIAELVVKGLWSESADAYQVVHHADVIRQSLVAQQKARETSKRTSARHRSKARQGADVSANEGPDVTRHVTDHADRQTDIQTALEGERSRSAKTDDEWGSFFPRGGSNANHRQADPWAS
jgi:hypothetical protein